MMARDRGANEGAVEASGILKSEAKDLLEVGDQGLVSPIYGIARWGTSSKASHGAVQYSPCRRKATRSSRRASRSNLGKSPLCQAIFQKLETLIGFNSSHWLLVLKRAQQDAIEHDLYLNFFPSLEHLWFGIVPHWVFGLESKDIAAS